MTTSLAPAATRNRSRAGRALLALAVTTLPLTAAATAQAQAPANTPVLPSTVSSNWTGFSSVPASSTDRVGVVLGALPAQGLAAFELSYPDGGNSNALAARWKRGGDTPLALYDDNFDYLDATRFQSSTSAYGTLIGYSIGSGPVDSRASGRILRPDGTWVRLPLLTGVQDASSDAVQRRWSLTDSGVVIYTERHLTSLKMYRLAPGATAAQTLQLTVPETPSETTPAISLPNGDVLIAAAFGPSGTPPVQKAAFVRLNSDGMLQMEPPVDLLGQPSSAAFELAASSDGWAFFLATERYTKSGQQYAQAHLTLHRRSPNGQWEAQGRDLDLGAASARQVRILPGTAGKVTVLAVVSAGNGEQLWQYDVAADGTVTSSNDIVSGETLRIDAKVAADGTQSLIWERVDAQQTQSAGRWQYSGPLAPNSVAFQRRAGVAAPWSEPQLLSKSSQLISPDAEAYVEPRLLQSGNALYAAWYEARDGGTAAALTTAVTGYTAEQPTPSTPSTPAAPAKPVTQAAAGSRTLKIDALLRFRSKARACPQSKNIAIAVRKQRTNGTLSSRPLATESVNLTSKLVSGGCQVTGTVVLKRRQKAGTRAGVTIRALGYRVRAVRITLQ